MQPNHFPAKSHSMKPFSVAAQMGDQGLEPPRVSVSLLGRMGLPHAYVPLNIVHQMHPHFSELVNVLNTVTYYKTKRTCMCVRALVCVCVSMCGSVGFPGYKQL